MFVLKFLIALAAAAVIFRIGFVMIRSMATPLPEPPPPGELRKVKLVYRCSNCGAELRMTKANDEVPEAPRHCMEDMDLVSTPDDA
jgi:hypothetical protein